MGTPVSRKPQNVLLLPGLAAGTRGQQAATLELSSSAPLSEMDGISGFSPALDLVAP